MDASDSSNPQLHTTVLHNQVDRMRAGDAAAADELVRLVAGRLERLARKMLRDFPGVARWEQTDDVLQNAVVRLLRSLRDVRPDSVQGFFSLAATQIRRELLDLARHYQGPQGHGANHASVAGGPGSEEGRTPPLDPADRAEDADDLERWAAFHRAVEQLPLEEREVVGLTFYHGWTQPDIAQLFQVDERTVRRRWRAACQRLGEALGGRLPNLEGR